MTEYWYRIDDSVFAPLIDDFGRIVAQPITERMTLYLRFVPVVRYTPRGVWLDVRAFPLGRPERFVLRDARKRWACPTVEEARQSFRARKERQFRIHTARARQARLALEALLDPITVLIKS